MKYTKLNETSNLIALYRHYVGKSEIPTQYHLWSCISLIAACVGDRVWVEKFRGSKLTPNLYVILLGPSGSGKGVAIDLATGFVQDNKLVNTYRGKTTGQYLVEHLGRRTKLKDGTSLIANPKLYLITPELSMSVGSGSVADDFIKMMTELYTGGDYLFQLGTRMYGNVTVRGHSINWLGGSTREWFIQSLTRDHVEGGALARMVLIPAEYDFEHRYTEPILPADHAFIKQHLEARIIMLTQLDDVQFVKSEAARKIEDQWYHARKPPADESLLPTWKRQHDLMLKLAMILSLADYLDYHRPPVIRAHHMAEAKRMSYTAQLAVPTIISLASIPPEHSGYIKVRDVIKKAGEGGIRRHILTRKCATRGVPRVRMDDFLKTLLAEKAIKKVHAAHGATWYVWRGGEAILSEVADAPTIQDNETDDDGGEEGGDDETS